jgi:hypothetical protein
MIWIKAAGVGAGLGIAYFGSLWLTVRCVVNQPSWTALVAYGGALRLVLLGVGLALLCRDGPGALFCGLGGLWLSRWFLVRRLGGGHHGR